MKVKYNIQNKIFNMEDKKQYVLEVGDPVSYKKDNFTYIGKIEFIDKKTGDYVLKVYNSKETKQLQLDRSSKLDSLFFITKEGKKIHTKFSYEETLNANKNSAEIKPKDFASLITSLMIGNKTDVITYDKKIDNSLAEVVGRLELRRDGNGNPYLKDNVKHKELNLDLPVYGLSLNELQKEQLLKTGELGLVSGFKSSNDKEFNLWVSLDKGLNKVATKRESDIYIDKIYGVTTTDQQKEKLKTGQNALIKIKDKNYLFQASAAATKSDGLKSFTEQKAKELKLIPELKSELNQEAKKSKVLKV